jgi:hypothetical protein
MKRCLMLLGLARKVLTLVFLVLKIINQIMILVGEATNYRCLLKTTAIGFRLEQVV